MPASTRAPSLCMAQSVGAVNLAAGLQDAYLACSPVIAITGRESQINQQRHAYQEVDHVNPFSAVTKYSAFVATPEQLPVYLRQAFRSATSGTPGPAHSGSGRSRRSGGCGARGGSGSHHRRALYPAAAFPPGSGDRKSEGKRSCCSRMPNVPSSSPAGV